MLFDVIIRKFHELLRGNNRPKTRLSCHRLMDAVMLHVAWKGLYKVGTDATWSRRPPPLGWERGNPSTNRFWTSGSLLEGCRLKTDAFPRCQQPVYLVDILDITFCFKDSLWVNPWTPHPNAKHRFNQWPGGGHFPHIQPPQWNWVLFSIAGTATFAGRWLLRGPVVVLWKRRHIVRGGAWAAGVGQAAGCHTRIRQNASAGNIRLASRKKGLLKIEFYIYFIPIFILLFIFIMIYYYIFNYIYFYFYTF